jgi:hypothetical protein
MGNRRPGTLGHTPLAKVLIYGVPPIGAACPDFVRARSPGSHVRDTLVEARVCVAGWAQMIVWMAAMVELVDLGKLGGVISAAASSVGRLADSVAKAVRLSNDGYDALLARRERTRLKRISKAVVQVSTGNAGNAGNIRSSITVFDEIGTIPAGHWKRSLKHFDKSLAEVESLLRRLRAERSDFVLEETYQEMVLGLESRRIILSALKMQPAPKSDTEISALVDILDEYERLREELIQARRALSDYVRSADVRRSVGRKPSLASQQKRRTLPKSKSRAAQSS